MITTILTNTSNSAYPPSESRTFERYGGSPGLAVASEKSRVDLINMLLHILVNWLHILCRLQKILAKRWRGQLDSLGEISTSCVRTFDRCLSRHNYRVNILSGLNFFDGLLLSVLLRHGMVFNQKARRQSRTASAGGST